ncbi:class I SAM-dependent methyltransferase [Nonomuraea lactucae]|uniref:class I SAM-dependent methyltransferase n=1 Tax=Nonomuraea lactucae TaxID=2249762 RepID=UPI000DE430F5|nr:class I SAM-dependent methyltransferase [Nonomuraea lactucae]
MTYYEDFLSGVYDSSPYFGQGRMRELDRFNAFYFERLREPGAPILEFGSATGMLTIPLARAGHTLDSVDNSSSMHKVLAGKLAQESEQVAGRVNQIFADALTYQGPGPYDTIVMPEGILIAIPDADAQLALLRSCHRNLAAGGVLLTDFFQPRYDVIAQGGLTEYSRFRTPSGETYLMEISFSNDSHSQVQEWRVTYSRVEDGEIVETTGVVVKFRYLFCSEVRLMLAACGFRDVEIDVDYAGGRGFAVAARKGTRT